MTRHKPIHQQVIAITGASSGIGLCTALMAAERGAKVVLIARSEQTLEHVVHSIEAEGGNALAVRADVASRDAMELAVMRALRRFGRIDTWVNNAGVAIYGKLANVSDQDSRRLFDVNFWGVVNGSLAALPALETSGGVLVNVGGEVSEAGMSLQGMDAASKHAVKGFTDALRVEVERVDKLPVSIVLIQPAAVDTPYPQHARNYLASEPRLTGPMIEPVRVADAILKAAERGGRDEHIGGMAVMSSAVARLFPRLADRISAMQAGRQQSTDIEALDHEGTLYRPGESGMIRGSASNRAPGPTH